MGYGASLTAGYHSGSPWEPYGKTLREELVRLEVPAAVHVCGHPGRTAQWLVNHLDTERVDDVPPGLKRLLEGQEVGHVDLVIIMVGKNDLGVLRPPSDIVDDIAELHAACSKRGIASVALDIPGSCGARAGERRSARELTNSLLREWAHSSGCLCVETDKLIPWTSDGPNWDRDGLHFSPEGSQSLGKALAPIIVDRLEHLDRLAMGQDSRQH